MSEEDVSIFSEERVNRKINGFIFRSPHLKDGAGIWELIKYSRLLDLNSSYCYLMLCRNFSETCILAEINEKKVGFVSAYFLPDDANTLFIWQIVVDEKSRGKGLAKLMIKELLKGSMKGSMKKKSYLQTTVTPSNKASDALFRSVAKEMNADCVVEDCFVREYFADKDHEEEMLYTIGPISKMS